MLLRALRESDTTPEAMLESTLQCLFQLALNTRLRTSIKEQVTPVLLPLVNDTCSVCLALTLGLLAGEAFECPPAVLQRAAALVAQVVDGTSSEQPLVFLVTASAHLALNNTNARYEEIIKNK